MSANVVIVQEADFDSAALTAALREQAGAGVGGIVTFGLRTRLRARCADRNAVPRTLSRHVRARA